MRQTSIYSNEMHAARLACYTTGTSAQDLRDALISVLCVVNDFSEEVTLLRRRIRVLEALLEQHEQKDGGQ